MAHFGRGRGEWAEGEHPPFWQPIVEEAVAQRKGNLTQFWKIPASASELERQEAKALAKLLEEIGTGILARLYPSAPKAWPHNEERAAL